MHSFHRSILIVILLLAPCAYAHAAQFAGVRDNKPADLAEVVKDVEQADVIFIGEIHYNAQHHKAQLDIIRSLHAKKHAIALGLEMFTPEEQQKLDDWVGGKLDEESFKTMYSRNWSYEWQLYRDLFIFARDNHIPLIALNIPKSVMSRLKAGGPPALQESEIPPKISWSLNESQANYMRIISRQVFGNTPPEKMVARFSEAQALRNSGMAWNIVKYKQKRVADKVVVLAGVWHAVKNGIPELLSAYGTFTYKVILPELTELSLENVTVNEADYLIMR
ncbi:MAG TPA: ChaN family lipoprotein [Geobacteraceae bacterium]